MEIEPIKKVRLSERVIETIKHMIIEEQFEPGDRFYSENELTRKLHVSRSSIREAVRILEATGQVNVLHGKGIFIADSLQQELEGFSQWLKTNESSILDHFDVRLIIDPKAAAYKCDEEFHMLLARSTKNKTLHFLMKTMTRSLPEGWISSLHIPGRARKTIDEHRSIIEAIKEGDSEKAEHVMMDHLNNALHDIRASINSSNTIIQ